jgi:hypothetical protein
MKKVVEQVARAVPLTIAVVDISTDPLLETRYGQEIPVLLVDGKMAAKFRVSVQELTRILRERSKRPGGSGESGGVGESSGSLTRPT